MNNFWLAVEDLATLTAMEKGFTSILAKKAQLEIKPTWFKAASKPARPFANMKTAFRSAQPDVLFYGSNSNIFPETNIMRRVPTVILLDSAPLCAFLTSTVPTNNNLLRSARSFFRPERLLKDSKKLPLAAGFVVWSEWTKRELIKNYGIAAHKIAVIPTGIDLENWDTALQNFRATQPQATQLPEKVRLLFVGSDFEEMGGDLLLKVLNSDPELARRYELHLVLNHADTTRLGATLRRDNVQTHTFSRLQKEAAELYLNADLFVLPTRHATNPSLLATALATGLPLITSRVEGLTELVQADKNGLLVEPNDARSLATAISTLIHDPVKRAELGKTSRAMAENLFQPATNAQQLITFLKQMPGEKRRPTTGNLQSLPRLVTTQIN